MEANHVKEQKDSILSQGCPQIFQNTQEGSVQDNIERKQKKAGYDNSQQSQKQVRPCKKKNGVENRNKAIEIVDWNRSNTMNTDEKKNNNIRITSDQRCVQQTKPLWESNGENNLSQKLKNQSSKGYFNERSSNQIRNQFYNNQKAENKQKFQYNQKNIFQNPVNSSNPPPFIFSQILPQIITLQNQFMFLQGSHAIYQVPGYMIQLNGSAKNSLQILDNLKPKLLPMGFCYLLEMLNLSYLFPDIFIFQKDTITKILSILQAPSDCKIQIYVLEIQNQFNKLLEERFQNFMNLLSSFIIQDLTCERLASISEKQCQNIVSLAKFSLENQLMEFVFKYNWPLILTQLANISMDSQKEDKIRFQKSIKYMKNNILTKSFNIPQNFDLRFQLISLLIDSYSKTNSFRDFFNKKIEINRNISKKKSQLEDAKKSIELKIKKLQNNKQKTKKIAKKDKKKSKNHQQKSQDLSENHSQFKPSKSIQKLLKQLEQIQQEIEKQNRQDSLSCCHYLGKDRNGNLYWYVSFFPLKIFIEQTNQSWICLHIDQINQLMDLLNKQNINQNRLLHKVQEYYQYSVSKHLAKMEIETEENNGQNPSANHLKSTVPSNPNRLFDLQHLIEPQNTLEHESSKNSAENEEFPTGLESFKVDQESLLRMIEQGQKKMTEYLKDRNSRWGTQQNKETLFSTIKGSGPNWLQDVKKQISLFNQKICVVEIQYKVFVQQSVEQVDSKIKKIQTKIWGINEKFKHNWYDFINSCSCFSELFFAVSVLYSLIKKYTSKHRKLRKQYEEIKQKTVWKNTAGLKQWKQTWNQTCEVCGNTGQVLCCDYCPKVYHLDCVKLVQIPEDQFKCKSCTEQITTRHQLKSIANEGKRHKKK